MKAAVITIARANQRRRSVPPAVLRVVSVEVMPRS
jgi:hypothetical protein